MVINIVENMTVRCTWCWGGLGIELGMEFWDTDGEKWMFNGVCAAEVLYAWNPIIGCVV